MSAKPLSLQSLIVVFGCDNPSPITVTRSPTEVVFYRDQTFIKAGSVDSFVPSQVGSYQLVVSKDLTSRIVDQ